MEERADAPKFQVGLVTYNVANSWDLPTLIRYCKEAHYGGMELRTTHAHGVEIALDAAQRKEVKRRFADAHTRLWGLGTVCEFHSPNANEVQAQIETCKRWCDLAKDVGAKGVKVRPNGLPEGVPVEKTLEQIGKALAVCGKAAQDAGVEIWVEVHGSGTARPAYMKSIMEACGHSQVGVCWNSNPQDIEDGSVKRSFELLQPWIRSCHINDLWSGYPYRELFALFRNSGYDGLTMCEVGSPVAADSGLVFLRCYQGLWRELQRA
jgi:sugar phosphate isomerase/epimerase